MTQKYQDGLFYDMGNGQELVYFKSPNEKVRPSGFVTEAEYRQFRANQTSSVDQSEQAKFNQARIGLDSVKQARALLAQRPRDIDNTEAALDAGEITPANWIQGPLSFRSKEGNPKAWGGRMAAALTPLRNTAFINQIQAIQKNSPTGGGSSLGNSEKEGQRLEGAFGSLAVGQDPEALARTLSNVEGMVQAWQPGLTPTSPMDLTAGQSRNPVPRGAFYRSPDGATRKNVSGDAGNTILWTPGGNENPQKPRLDARLAWNDAWFREKGNMKGAEEAFNRWWANYSKTNPEKATKAFPRSAPPPPRVKSGAAALSDDQIKKALGF